ncbi:hypothetical protein Droror1_Dr00011368 [Drosera rotundifolia]
MGTWIRCCFLLVLFPCWYFASVGVSHLVGISHLVLGLQSTDLGLHSFAYILLLIFPVGLQSFASEGRSVGLPCWSFENFKFRICWCSLYLVLSCNSCSMLFDVADIEGWCCIHEGFLSDSVDVVAIDSVDPVQSLILYLLLLLLLASGLTWTSVCTTLNRIFFPQPLLFDPLLMSLYLHEIGLLIREHLII